MTFINHLSNYDTLKICLLKIEFILWLEFQASVVVQEIDNSSEKKQTLKCPFSIDLIPSLNDKSVYVSRKRHIVYQRHINYRTVLNDSMLCKQKKTLYQS